MYAALAGFSIPTQRALIMLVVWMLSLFFNRRYASRDIISISLLAVLIIDPFAAMDAGFWLSFIAISIIAYGMTCRVQTNVLVWRNAWWKWGRVQYLVAVGLFPLLVLWFQQYPLLGILANIIAVPYVSLIVVPLVLLGIVLLAFAFPVGEFVLHLAGQTLAFFWPFLEYLASLEFNLWHSAAPSTLAFVTGMIGVLILLLPKGMPARWIGVFWLIPLLSPHSETPETGEFWLAQLDVGQGLASVIQTQGHTLIYDAGDKFSERFNAADAVIIPYLKQQNIRRPDLLIVSHGDRDHIGGAEALLKKYPEIQVLTSIEEKIDHSKVEKCVEGQSWQWDGVEFEILSPTHPEDYQGNNSSCVLKVGNDQHSILMAGDIEQATESRLIRTQLEKLSANLLIAPHHGSKTSSSLVFIDAVAPDFVVFPVGYRNRFGFPKQDIISRYESRQVKILNTARDGALLFRFEDPEMIFSRYRHDNQQFWTSGY
jgi:competence protein ComEC